MGWCLLLDYHFNYKEDWTLQAAYSAKSPIFPDFTTILDLLPHSLACKVQSSTLCTSQQKVDTTLYFYTSFNEHNTPYTVLESDNSESMPDVLH